jgi:hypothetical protein
MKECRLMVIQYYKTVAYLVGWLFGFMCVLWSMCDVCLLESSEVERRLSIVQRFVTPTNTPRKSRRQPNHT